MVVELYYSVVGRIVVVELDPRYIDGDYYYVLVLSYLYCCYCHYSNQDYYSGYYNPRNYYLFGQEQQCQNLNKNVRTPVQSCDLKSSTRTVHYISDDNFVEEWSHGISGHVRRDILKA
jgi:hypothetical protein